jgi:hypothetical protein
MGLENTRFVSKSSKRRPLRGVASGEGRVARPLCQMGRPSHLSLLTLTRLVNTLFVSQSWRRNTRFSLLAARYSRASEKRDCCDTLAGHGRWLRGVRPYFSSKWRVARGERREASSEKREMANLSRSQPLPVGRGTRWKSTKSGLHLAACSTSWFDVKTSYRKMTIKRKCTLDVVPVH